MDITWLLACKRCTVSMHTTYNNNKLKALIMNSRAGIITLRAQILFFFFFASVGLQGSVQNKDPGRKVILFDKWLVQENSLHSKVRGVKHESLFNFLSQ